MKENWFIALTWKEMFKENDLIKVFFHMNYFAWGKRNILAYKYKSVNLKFLGKSKGRTRIFPLVLLKDANIFYLFESNLLDQG